MLLFLGFQLSVSLGRHVVVNCDGPNENAGGSGIETTPIGDLEEDNISRNLMHHHILRLTDFAHDCVVLP